MLLEIYPKPDGMQHINFMFCAAESDPEDAWIRAHLESFLAPPKRIFEEERNGRAYTTLQSGQCVIGHSMFYIEKHKGVVDLVSQVCTADVEQLGLDRLARNNVISRLALELDKLTRFAVDDDSNLSIALKEIDEAVVRKCFRELVNEDESEQQLQSAGSGA